MRPQEYPVAILVILIGALLLVNLIPSVRSAVTNATHITGVTATLLGYLGLAIIGGYTLLIIAKLVGGLGGRGGRTRYTPNFAKFMHAFVHNTKAISLMAGVALAFSAVICLLLSIPFLDQMALWIENATNSTGSLYGTPEAVLLQNWTLIIGGSMVLGVFLIFIASPQGKRASARFRRRR